MHIHLSCQILKVIHSLLNLLMHILTNRISDFNIFAVDNKLHIQFSQLTIIQTFLGEAKSYVNIAAFQRNNRGLALLSAGAMYLF